MLAEVVDSVGHGVWVALRAVWRVLASAEFRATVKGVLYRYRDQLWPLWVGLALALARWWAAGSPVPAVAAVVALTAVIVVFHVRRKLNRTVEWVYTAVCLVAVGGGLLFVSPAGTGVRWLNTASIVTWAGLSLIWWCHHEVRWAGHARSLVVNRWNLYIRDGKGPMAGAELSDPVPFDHGDTHVLRLVPGKQHLGTVQQHFPLIASGVRTPMHQLLVEPHPEHKDPSVLRFQVITRSPIERPVLFTGPKVVDGRIQLGPHADGLGTASWRIFTENSMHGGFLLGGTGSGKSRLLELIAIAALSAGAVVIYLDGQSGASSPTLWKYATLRGGPDDATEILGALERGKAARQVYNRVHRLAGFTPSPELPGILVIVDECHILFTPKTADRWANLSREGRKVGIAEVGASQYSGLATFGGADPLRSTMLDGNGVAFRTSSKISAQLMPGLDLNPASFPSSMPGYGYYIPGSDPGARVAPFRAEWPPDATDKRKHPEIGVPTVEEWFQRIPGPELDEVTVRAFGEVFTGRHARAAAQEAADRAWLAGETPAPALPTPASVADIGEQSQKAATTADAILALPWTHAMSRQDIIQGLKDGDPPLTPTISAIDKAMRKLREEGLLEQDGAGQPYRRTVGVGS